MEQRPAFLHQGIVEGPAADRANAVEAGEDACDFRPLCRRDFAECFGKRPAEPIEAVGVDLAEMKLVPVDSEIRVTVEHHRRLHRPERPNLFRLHQPGGGGAAVFPHDVPVFAEMLWAHVDVFQ